MVDPKTATSINIKDPPKQTPIRVLVCVWWLSTIVIVNIYFGILFGQLVLPRRPRSIESLEELVVAGNGGYTANVNQVTPGKSVTTSGFEWSVTKGSAISQLFQAAPKDSIYARLADRMRLVESADEGVRRSLEYGWAFIREKSILTFKLEAEHTRLKSCRLQLAKEEFYSVGFGIGLTKGSQYLRPFNSALTLMIESGFVARWIRKYWPKRNQFTECHLNEALSEGSPLSMKHFISIYLVCGSLVGAALILLIYQRIQWLLAGERPRIGFRA